ncbi:MAG: phosphatase PAP2 family protein [Brevibacterium sp.]
MSPEGSSGSNEPGEPGEQVEPPEPLGPDEPVGPAHRPQQTIRQPTWLLLSTLPAILLVAAFGLWLHLDVVGPTPVDRTWLDLVGLTPGTVPYHLAVILAVVGGGTGAVICTGLLTAVFVLCRRFRTAGFLASAMLIGIGLSELLKALVTRIRPTDQLYDSLGWSYPSGHSMGAAALAVSLAIIVARSRMLTLVSHDEPGDGALPRLRFHWSMLLALAWVLVMMWSRTALQVHWLSDTIAGALIGISAAVLADELWTWMTTKSQNAKARPSPRQR